MKHLRKVAILAVLTICLVVPVYGVASASNTAPGLSDVINGQTQPTEQETQPTTAPTVIPQPTVVEEYSEIVDESEVVGEYSGGLVDIGGLSGEDISGYANITQSTEAQNTVQSTLGQIMGWVVPILVGIIFAALTVRILLDLLYIVAPFLRHKLAPGVQGDGMAENQMGGGMQGGMGGMGGMGMQGGMGGMGMQGGMGGMGGMGMQGGYGGRRGMGRGQQGMQQGMMPQGTQWVSESAIAAVMAANQVGPNGKPNNPFIVYTKSMFVPLILVPIMLILLLSGVLTNVGFYLGDLISGAINSKIN